MNHANENVLRLEHVYVNGTWSLAGSTGLEKIDTNTLISK